MHSTSDIGRKLWSLCDVLRDDGITYLQYVTELTYLLFLKMMQETDQESLRSEGKPWEDLVAKDGIEQLDFYRDLLRNLGRGDTNKRVQVIYANAQNSTEAAPKSSYLGGVRDSTPAHGNLSIQAEEGAWGGNPQFLTPYDKKQSRRKKQTTGK